MKRENDNMNAVPSPRVSETPVRRTTLALVSASDPRRRAGNVSAQPANCGACNLRELCLPCGLSGSAPEVLAELVYTRRRIKRGETLYRAGAAFESLYAVRSGFLKSRVLLEDGRDQVTGFHMAGEVVGMDGIGTDTHSADVIALEDSEVCVIPYALLEEPHLRRQLQKMMSREMVREQGVMMLLGSMRAEERLATFLLNLSQRFVARGYARDDFHLRMTREEIGSYLGLSLETVSRLFSRFQDDGLMTVQQKHIHILDIPGLKAMMSRDAA